MGKSSLYQLLLYIIFSLYQQRFQWTVHHVINLSIVITLFVSVVVVLSPSPFSARSRMLFAPASVDQFRRNALC